ncbi:MAG TPA: hypothetical protein VHA70_04850 [Bauldia sp.]|nr:hypothetical protein [Bauldia sp.]
MASHDIILPPGTVASSVSRSKLAAFVPLTLALIGVAAVLVGGVSARHDNEVAARAIDPVTTGSILSPDDQRRALEMLDR